MHMTLVEITKVSEYGREPAMEEICPLEVKTDKQRNKLYKTIKYTDFFLKKKRWKVCAGVSST